jgi:hypothetical protein
MKAPGKKLRHSHQALVAQSCKMVQLRPCHALPGHNSDPNGHTFSRRLNKGLRDAVIPL